MSQESNSELRCRLDKITSQSPDNWERLISELAPPHCHSIERLEVVTAHPYNCYEYAFELVGSCPYRLIAETDADLNLGTYIAEAEFAHFLIESVVLKEINKDEIRPDDVVVYLDIKGTPQHAGKVGTLAGRIKSKWGCGPFFEHGLWEVPKRYGNTFFRSIHAVKAERAFRKFVEAQNGHKNFIQPYDLEDCLKKLGDDVS